MAIRINADSASRGGDLWYMNPHDIIVDHDLNGRCDEPDPAALGALAHDMEVNGQLQAVICRRVQANRPQLVLGYHRVEAAKLIVERNPGWRLKVVIQDMSDKEALLANIRENRLRQTVTPVDTATNIRRLADQFGMERKEIAAFYQIDVSGVGQYLKLLNLPDAIRKRVASGDLAMAPALKLAKLSPEEAVSVVEAATVDVPEPTPVMDALVTEADGGDQPTDQTQTQAVSPNHVGRKVLVGAKSGTVTAITEVGKLEITLESGASVIVDLDSDDEFEFDDDPATAANAPADTMPKVFPVPALAPTPQATYTTSNGQTQPKAKKTKIDPVKLAEESRKAGIKIARATSDLRKLMGGRKEPLCVAILGYLDGILDEASVEEAIKATFPE